MGNPRRSRPETRRHLVMSGGITALLAAILLVGADSQRVSIAQWIAAEPANSLGRMRAVLVGLSLAGVSPLLYYAVALWRATGRSNPGERTRGDPRKARQTRWVAAALFAIACAIPLALWWLAASVTPETH